MREHETDLLAETFEFDDEFQDDFGEDDFGEDEFDEDEFDDESLSIEDMDAEFDEMSPVYAEALTEVLREDYAGASPEQLHEALHNMWETMTPAEVFNFKKVLRSIRKIRRNPIVGKIATTALPVAGGAIGTYFGGPAGTALGAKLGQAAGSAFTTGGGRRKPQRSQKPARGGPQAGSAAASQLLQLTRDPNMLKSLLALSLGSQGRSGIPVGGKAGTVPIGAFMNMLGSLAGKASADADALARENVDQHQYLMDDESDGGVDYFSPEARAETLYGHLADAGQSRFEVEAEDTIDEFESEFDPYFSDTDDESEFFDGGFADEQLADYLE